MNAPATVTVDAPLPFACPNCIREWPEPFCDVCGRHIPLSPATENERAGRHPSVTSTGPFPTDKENSTDHV